MWRYALTIFLGAFLLFLVQPLIGKYILPWFGGGAGVWTVCMLFFQIALLAGYAYAHLLVMRLRPAAQMWIHLGLLAAALLFLPIVPDSDWKPEPESNPIASILLLLGSTIGLPFVVVSATGPLMQAWFSRTHAGLSPYRLYALSNAGSLLALLCYPFVVEPALPRISQAMMWSGGYVVFALVCGYCAVMQSRFNTQEAPPIRAARGRTKDDSTATPLFDQLLWLLLPAFAVIMLLAVTSQLSEEVAPVPLLWVMTFAVYLLTFIICFEWPSLYRRAIFSTAMILAPWIVLLLLLDVRIGIRSQVVGYMAALFICCMVCHGELYRLRPPPRRLTAYYLMIAAGGALGGCVVAIAAPLLFTRNLELYVGLYGSLALLMICLWRGAGSIFYRGRNRAGWLAMIAIALAAGFLLELRLIYLEEHIVLRARNFYGSLSLKAIPSRVPDTEFRELRHGRITHGAQHFNEQRPEIRRIPTTYYGSKTAVGIILQEVTRPVGRRVGIVGLGAGAAATFAQPGDAFRFYEINPHVIQFAELFFTYLDDARHRNVTVDVVLNDARLALEREEPQRFDILMLDAFSGDAIPVHLLTKEAFDIYEKHLAQDGVILVNVANRYLELLPVVHRLAEELNMATVFVDTPADRVNMVEHAHWVVLTRDQGVLNLPQLREAGFWPPTKSPAPLWTDDHASILDALR